MTSIFSQGYWVTVEDMYDHDTRRLGPFPSVEAAFAYCDAYNATQLTKSKDGRIPTNIDSSKDVGVWSLATATGYEPNTRLLELLRDPAMIPAADPPTLMAQYGAKHEYEWHDDINKAIAPLTCWCEQIRAGQMPEADGDVILAYLQERLGESHDLFTTDEHHGDASYRQCANCHGTIFHLTVEHEGFGDAIHHYFTPADSDAVNAVATHELHSGNFEDWVGARGGLYKSGYSACFYAGAEVGYPGIDHKLRF